MEEGFEPSVTYNGQELLVPAQLRQFGDTHRFVVDVNGQEIYFEPDEKRAYRALIDPDRLQDEKVDLELLKTIAAAIETVLK